MAPGPHQLAQERSIALHAAVAEAITQKPERLERARTRVQRWLADGSTHPAYARAWDQLLARPVEEITAALVEPGEPMATLRSCSPFAGAISARERWRILAEVRGRQAG